MGAAVAVAALLGLSRDACADAVGFVGSTAGGLWAFLDEETDTKQWHAGHAASQAVVACGLAEAGLRGPRRLFESARGFFAILCDDPDPAALAGNGGWQIHGTAYKPWPSPRPTHAAVSAALAVRDRLASRRIGRVAVATFGMAVDLCNRSPVATPHDARFSIAHGVAAALTDGAVGFDAFEPERIAALAPLVARTTVVEDPAMTAAYPARSQAWVCAWTVDGDAVEARVEHALGDPASPLDGSMRRTKHRALLGRAGLRDVDGALAAIEAVRAAPHLPGPLTDVLPEVFGTGVPSPVVGEPAARGAGVSRPSSASAR